MDEKSQQFIEKCINKLKPIFVNKVPEAPIDIKIKKMENGFYLVRVLVSLEKGQLGAIRTDSLSDILIEDIYDELQSKFDFYLNQIERDVFQFDTVTQSDFYNEINTLEDAEYKFKVLILEDDLVTSKILMRSLKKVGGYCFVKQNPLEALRVIENEDIDMLFLDWNLPYFNGESFLKKADVILQKKEIKHKIPLIICTSLLKSDIFIPHVHNFKLEEIWNKSYPFSVIFNSIESIVKNEKLSF